MNQASFTVSRGRLDALTDGLFAIAMTILVLELHAPDLAPGANLPAFKEALFRQGPSLLGYVASFALLGLFWYQHHRLTHGLRRIDLPFFIANLFFLLLAGSFPFTLALVLRLRHVDGGSFALIPYMLCLGGLLLALSAMAFLALWRDLLEPHAPAAELRRNGVGWLISALFVLGLALAQGRIPNGVPYLALLFVPYPLWRRWQSWKAKASD